MSPKFPFDELDRQECDEYPTHASAVASARYSILQLKYDGIWTKLIVTDGVARWLSRTNECKKTSPTTLPNGVYVGEFMFGSHWSQYHERTGKTYLFDFVWDGDNDLRLLSYSQRYRFLVDRLRHNRDGSLILVSCVTVGLAQQCWKRVVAEEYEGLIFRDANAPYGDKIGRVKREVTVDYVVRDVVEGNGRLTGSLGSLVLGLHKDGCLTTVTKMGGGFTDEQRSDIWNHWPRDQGRVVTIRGNGLFPSGAVKHPRFERFRDDKKPEECKYE